MGTLVYGTPVVCGSFLLGPRFVILSSLVNISLKTREMADLHLGLSIDCTLGPSLYVQ